MATYSNGKRSSQAGAGVVGALRGICVGTSPTSIRGDGTFGRHLQVGISQSLTEGSPGAPSLAITQPGFHRFRWALKTAGTRSIQINCLQSGNGTKRPTMVIKANTAIGVNSDIVGTAPVSNGWVTIGPISVTNTAAGSVWVELRNNYTDAYSTAYFDHLVRI